MSKAAKTPHSVSDLPPPIDAAYKPAFDDLVKGGRWSGASFSLERLPTKQEREAFMVRLRGLETAVKPVSYAAASRQSAGIAVAEMFKGWPTFKGKSEEHGIGYYVTKCNDIPLFAVQRACKQIFDNAARMDKNFPPSADVVADLAREQAAPVLSEYAALRRVVTTRTTHTLSGATVEQRARATEAAAQRVAELKKLSEPAKPAKVELTDDWRKAWRERFALNEYLAAGMEPVYGPYGVVSLSFLKNVRQAQLRPKPKRDRYQDQGT